MTADDLPACASGTSAPQGSHATFFHESDRDLDLEAAAEIEQLRAENQDLHTEVEAMLAQLRRNSLDMTRLRRKLEDAP